MALAEGEVRRGTTAERGHKTARLAVLLRAAAVPVEQATAASTQDAGTAELVHAVKPTF